MIEVFGLSPTDVTSRPMGSGGEDIILGDESRKVFPYSIEAKHRQSYKGLWDSYEQAKDNAPEGAEPVFVVRTDRKPALAVIDFEHFLHLVWVDPHVKNETVWEKMEEYE